MLGPSSQPGVTGCGQLWELSEGVWWPPGHLGPCSPAPQMLTSEKEVKVMASG